MANSDNAAPFVNYLFDNNVDGSPLYLGEAKLGIAEDDPRWTVYKFDYDVDGNVTQIRVQSSVRWDERTVIW